MKSIFKDIGSRFWIEWILRSMLGGVAGSVLAVATLWVAPILLRFCCMSLDSVGYVAGAGIGLGVGGVQSEFLRGKVFWAKQWFTASILVGAMVGLVLEFFVDTWSTSNLVIFAAIWAIGSAIAGAIQIIQEPPRNPES